MGLENMTIFAEKTSVIYLNDTGFATFMANGEILIQTQGTPIIGDKVEELTIMNLSGLTDITAEQYTAFARYSPTHAMIHGTKLPGKQGVTNIFFSINDCSKDSNIYYMRWVISWDRSLIYKNIKDINAGPHELTQEIAVQFCDPFKSIVQDTDPALRFG
ncbi:hypothetical protein BC943DRAFT_321324 [Umbelopsis sp. AD052]|nr:hypothetical protein BC943DRAFT_321324 [Umbelopsis sp. AD052]